MCLTISLVMMIVFKAILWCMGAEEARDALVLQQCAEADDSQRPYSILSMLVRIVQDCVSRFCGLQ